jgi:hypothetical protein
MSERSEFLRTPPKAPEIRLPRRGHGQQGRLSLPTFFGEAKKVGALPGASPGSPTLRTAGGESVTASRLPNASTDARLCTVFGGPDEVRCFNTCDAQGWEAGKCPRHGHLLFAPPKSKQKAAPAPRDPLRGQPVFASLGRGPRKLAPLRCAQTSAALFPPKRCKNRHGQKGGGGRPVAFDLGWRMYFGSMDHSSLIDQRLALDTGFHFGGIA